jgi:hypothetical protein
VRIAAIVIVIVLASPALAFADGTSFDLGYVRSRVAVTDQTALDAAMLRFAIRLDLDRRIQNFHFGAECEEGSLHGTTNLSGGAVARTAPGAEQTGTQEPGTMQPTGPDSPLYGNVLALKVFAGIHANPGPFRISGDVAMGVRDTWVESDLGPDVAGRKNEGLLELRTRVDYRITPRVLIGATATSDVIERRNVSLGLMLAFDASR